MQLHHFYLNRGSYKSALVLLNILNKLMKNNEKEVARFSEHLTCIVFSTRILINSMESEHECNINILFITHYIYHMTFNRNFIYVFIIEQDFSATSQHGV